MPDFSSQRRAAVAGRNDDGIRLNYAVACLGTDYRSVANDNALHGH